ncbi:MAG: hypothetical protein CMI60_03020 [Parvibaculum sp.]|nr:hypothetical protein [Parvibaculum sp.]|tara:strand:- start:1394 stop:1735 length:342 start_codon:yes stop_codon:yes gene_type:complete
MSEEVSYKLHIQGGMLRSVKTETTVKRVDTFKPDNEWFDATFIELLLLIDETPRTVQQLIKHSPNLRLKTHTQINSVLKMLKERELAMSEKVNNKHTTWRRTHCFSKHAGGFY